MSAHRSQHWLAGAMLGLFNGPVFAAITVGAGSSLQFADSTVDLGCSDLTIAGAANGTTATIGAITNLNLSGSFAPGAGRISLGGNFANTGSFVPGNSQVAIVDACGNGTGLISGATNFYDFVVATASGKQTLFPVAAPQSIEHSLTLQGAAGHLLNIGSSAPGQRGVLAVAKEAAQAIAYVSARDNNASIARIAPGPPAQFNSVDAGNLANWFLAAYGDAALVPAPALGADRWILVAAMLLAAARYLFRRERKIS